MQDGRRRNIEGICRLSLFLPEKERRPGAAPEKPPPQRFPAAEGIFAVVVKEGAVRAGDAIEVLEIEHETH